MAVAMAMFERRRLLSSRYEIDCLPIDSIKLWFHGFRQIRA